MSVRLENFYRVMTALFWLVVLLALWSHATVGLQNKFRADQQVKWVENNNPEGGQ